MYNVINLDLNEEMDGGEYSDLKYINDNSQPPGIEKARLEKLINVKVNYGTVGMV